MRYGMQSQGAAEWFAMKAGLVPQPILDVILGPLQGRALMVAVRTGIMDYLATKPGARVTDIAAALQLDDECTQLLLRVLRGMNYLSLCGDSWYLSKAGGRYFGLKAAEPYSAFAEYGMPQWDMTAKLEEVVRSGRGVDFHDGQSVAEWQTYQRAMFENARAFAWFVVQNMPVAANAKKCLDIAGAHGWVSYALSQKYPQLKPVVFDRAEALAHAREIAERAGYASALQFVAGDIRKDKFDGGNDVVLLCNILHHFPAQENVAILRRVRQAMNPGGSIGIFEIETPKADAKAEAAGDGFALFFRITSDAACYRGDEYVAWLVEAGFAKARVVRSVRMPSRMLVVAERG